MGLEPATIYLDGRASTTELAPLMPHSQQRGAWDRVSTGDLVLTKDALYQLSYPGSYRSPHFPARCLQNCRWGCRASESPQPFNKRPSDCPTIRLSNAGYWWTGKDSNLRSPQGAADLQSAGFSHSPTRPAKTFATLTARSLKSSGTQLHPASLSPPD